MKKNCFEFCFFKIATSKFKIAGKFAVNKRKTELTMTRSENVNFLFNPYMSMDIDTGRIERTAPWEKRRHAKCIKNSRLINKSLIKDQDLVPSCTVAAHNLSEEDALKAKQ